MRPFSYTWAESTSEAASFLGRSGNHRLLAGGTTLIDLMKLRVETPERLMDVTRLPLSDIQVGDKGIEIGATVTNTALAEHPVVESQFPVLSQAILSGASPQIRNKATVAGNLLQRTRCPYFRDGVSACNKREPESGCAARGGMSSSLAVLGTSPQCSATHPSDMAVALTALEAIVRVEGSDGVRELPLSDFYLLPGKTPHLENILAAGELIVGVFVPFSPRARRSVYLKARDRASYEFALASVAGAIELEAGVIRSVNLVLGGVGTRPWRATEAERVLTDQVPDEALFWRAAEATFANAEPLEHNRFKIELGRRLMVKALKQIFGAAP